MGLMDQIGHALMDNDELHFATESRCSPEERWLVALSAPLSAFNGNFVNAVETGQSPEALREGVAGMWGVQDRKSFEQTARWIVDEGHREKYRGVWHGLVKLDTAHRSAPLLLRSVASLVFPGLFMLKLRGELDYEAFANQTGKSVADIATLMGSYSDWMDDLRKPLGVQPAEITDLVAWDAVRLASLSRWAVDLGYIDRGEFTGFASGLAGPVRAAYGNWAQVSAAYVAAGLIWNYSEARQEALVRTNAMLFSDPRSPYKDLPLH
ncbi:DUF1266 domain-containing protein [Variovorax sp. LjRoot290]|uniref:DUF1266 domain-containing protein n=1 Tax=unclassified Variovorax TaxID=663243 RepID=UPI003ED14498